MSRRVLVLETTVGTTGLLNHCLKDFDEEKAIEAYMNHTGESNPQIAEEIVTVILQSQLK